MKTSEQVSEIFAAIVKAQGEIINAKATADNPFFKSKYADLAELINTAKKPLADNDLAVIQSPSTEGNQVIVTGRVIHKSGQWIEDSISFETNKKDPQSIGTVITYGRRYQLAAFVGIAQEDDDGNSGSASGKAQEPIRNAPPAPAPKPAPEPKPLTRMQLFNAEMASAGLSPDETKTAVFSVCDPFDYPTVKDAIANLGDEGFKEVLTAIRNAAVDKEAASA